MPRLTIAVGTHSRPNPLRTPAGVRLSRRFGWLLPVALLAAHAMGQTPPGQCPSVPDVAEGEGCGIQVNPGCDGAVQEFTDADCGDLVCATTWADNGTRDVDWYRLDVEDLDNSGSDEYVLEFHSSVPLLAHVQLGCWDPPVEVQDCQFDVNTGEWIMEMTLCAPVLSELLIRVAPGFQASGPIVEGYPCVAGGEPYYFTVTCNNECDDELCPECIRAPEGMVAWWMMDEPANVASSVDVVGNHNLTHNGGVVSGIDGEVNEALRLDGISGHLRTPDSLNLNFEAGDDFSLMGWIKIDGGSGTRILYSKMTVSNSPVGWGLGLTNDNRLQLLLRDQVGGAALAGSSASVPSARWVHIGVTIDRDNASGIRFYINGVASGTGNPTAAQGDLTTATPLYLGAVEEVGGPNRFFNGGLDEMIIVDHPMADSYITKIAEAGCGGLCRERFHVTRFAPFCDGDNTTVAAVTIFNDLPQDMSYDLSFDGVQANGIDCTIDGPVIFTSDTANPIQVPALGRKEVLVTVNRPQGMDEDAETGCWRALLVETGRVEPSQIRRGYVTQSDAICVEPVGLPLGVRSMPIGEITPFNFIVHNRTAVQYQLIWKVRAIDSLSGDPNTLIKLNAEEPGDPVLGQVDIGGNDSELIQR